MDPLAENYFDWTPYNYALNNPVKFIDKDGKAASNPQDKIKQKVTTTNPDSPDIKATIKKGMALSNITHKITKLLLKNHFVGGSDYVSEKEYNEIYGRVYKRVTPSLYEDVLNLTIDGRFNTAENNIDIGEEIKDRYFSRKKKKFVKNVLNGAEAKKWITKGAKKAIGTSLSVVSYLFDPIEVGESSLEGTKDAKAVGAVIKGFSSETTMKEILKIAQDELNKLNSNQE